MGVNSSRNYKHIYSTRMAGYLLLKGFVPEEYQKSHNDSERTIFFFPETDELLRAMTEFNRLKNFNGNIVNI